MPAAESNAKAKKVLWISIFICLGFMIAEIIGGIWAQSLAIITDAAHLLTDFASMMISLFSLYIASRPPSQRMSFGWHRAGKCLPQIQNHRNLRRLLRISEIGINHIVYFHD